jgi:hypothetical protein
MQVNRASTLSLRSASARTDSAASAMGGEPVNGVAPIAGAENGLSDDAPPPRTFVREEGDPPEQLIDAIDPDIAYRAASSMLRRQGMVGLLLNRNA